MYAILQQSGHQYRVSPGDRLLVDRLAAEVGSVVALEPVVLVAGDDGTQVGTPVVDGVRVAATVVGHSKGGKIRVFKYKPKKHYRRTHGHRSLLTELRVEAVLAAGEKLPEPKPAPAPKAEKPAAKADKGGAAKAEKGAAKAEAKAEKPAAKTRTRAKAEAPADTAAAVETPAEAAAPEVHAEAPAAPEAQTTPAAAKPRRTKAAATAAADEAAAEEGAQGALPQASDEAASDAATPKRRSRSKKTDGGETEA